MASPPIPPLLEHLISRPFSLYPAIVHVDHNEWLFRKATWSEIVVVNRKSTIEIAIPRRFVGDVSLVDDPVLIVGLTRELEYSGGMIIPVQRRVIPMPLAVGESRPAAASRAAAPAPVVGIRVESRSRSRKYLMVAAALAFLIIALLLIANASR